MKSVSGKRFAQVLEQRGWQLMRVNGSHHVYMMQGNPARVSLPIHKNDDLKIGLLKHLMKIAELSESDV